MRAGTVRLAIPSTGSEVHVAMRACAVPCMPRPTRCWAQRRPLLEHDDCIDLVEAGRRLGHDIHDNSRLPVQPGWPAAVLEGFHAAQARGARRPDPDRHTRKCLQLRLNALARGRSVAADVTPAALQALDLPACPITREPLTHGTGSPSDGSIDRLNNDGGYVLANLAVMSARANRAKAALDFDAVLDRAASQRPRDGLAPGAWLRLAVLMLGPSFAQRPLDAPDLPLCVALPATTLRTATQQVQRLLTLSAAQAPERNRVLRGLAPAGSCAASARRLALLAERLHHGLKQLPPGAECWDVWLCPETMACLHAWKAGLAHDDWAQVAWRAGQLVGGRPVSARTLAPWQLAFRGYAKPAAGRTSPGH